MNLPTITLVDPLYCNGCPCSFEIAFQAHCLLLRLQVLLDTETTDRRSFMKRLRPDICREKNGV